VVLICSCLTKEVGLMTIFPILYLEIINGDERKSYLWLTPLSIAIILAFITRLYVIQGENPDLTMLDLLTTKLLPREVDRAMSVQLTTQSFVWLKYFALWLFPIQQTIYHHVANIEFLSLWGMLSWTGWLLSLGGLFWVGRKDQACIFALLCLFVYLMPSSSFAPLKEHMAEHRSLQFGLYFIAYITWFFEPKFQSLQLIVIPAVLLSLWTYQRNTVWTSEVSLWEEATQIHPEVGEAWYGLGDALRFADRHEEAEKAFQISIQKDAEYWDAYNNLGLVRIQMNDVEGAITAWEILLQKNSSYCKAHNNLGLLAARMGHCEISHRL
jgi:tetratricopeptide (TPR) repeat protein